jgi:prolyl-tRNA editing enzyme YbaK/EbsC (Cys-tRNA(Pro) deacylase)
MADASHPNCVAVDAALSAAGCAGRVRILTDPAPSAVIAAVQVGVAVGAIANSLIFVTEAYEPVLVMASGAHRVDTEVAADAFGVRSLRRASAAEVKAATGQPIGGVAPVAHPEPLRCVVDEELAHYDELWAAGGVPQAVFPTTYAELLSMTGGRKAAIA